MFEDWTTAVATWVGANTVWAAPATFLIAFLESFPVISIVVPSTALLLAMGALIGSGLVDPWPVLLACAAGGILGDAAGYWLARLVGPQAIRRRLPRSCWRAYAWSTTVFRRWGWWAVFVGRFIGPMRAVTPLAAGVTGMRNLPFQTANILSALVWAPVVLMPGAVGGWIAQRLGTQPSAAVLAALAGVAVLLWLGHSRMRPMLSSAMTRSRNSS
ncbi:DedA family protein [Roseomonas populi]|uniref:DedA family protein n=1 Tax=Roseomonas populi TaxID=3121582 RepID=A0ABT1X6U5_9PROT|nr:DedA family protein [Roseomonas pecuniae]MCR0983118.1 DedA family protein [Roseomonas pecuniae]